MPPEVPRERGWRRVVGGLALLLLVPAMPPFSVIFPVAETALMLVPAIAACALAGWKSGGRPFLAVLWVAFAAWIVVAGAAQGEYALLARGWGVLVAVAFAAWAMLWPERSFLPRALATVGVALVIGGTMSLAVPGGPTRV